MKLYKHLSLPMLHQLFYGSLGVIGAFVIFFFQQQSQGHTNYILLGFVGLFGLLAWICHGQIKMAKFIRELSAQWGKPNNRKRNMTEIKKLYATLLKKTPNTFYIDDQTWNDLNMDSVFETLDRSLSTPGEQMLYHILRSPLFEESILAERKSFLSFFGQKEESREELLLKLASLDRYDENLLIDLLWEEHDYSFVSKGFLRLLTAAAIGSIASIFLLGLPGILFVMLMFMVNISIHYSTRKKVLGHLSSIRYLSRLIRTAAALGNSKNPLPQKYAEILKSTSAACSRISQKSWSLKLDSFDSLGVGEYINIIFLQEARSFFAIIDEVRAHLHDLQQMYQTVGEVDALLSIASYRAGLDHYVEPRLRNEDVFLDIKNIRHPLIPDPVPNSIRLYKKGALLTGSNMSGKSTFLRSIGVNAVFAQTICTCLADQYESSYFQIMSSISRSDNLIGGKSYYLAEAETILSMIRSLNAEVPSLCIIDEIFRGTNSLERINASIELLNYFIHHHSITLVATHDIEITKMVHTTYETYFFSESVDDQGIHFDYLLKKGISNTRNATKILQFLGYPSEIVEQAEKRISQYLSAIKE